MTEQNDWELVELGLPAMPGLCLVTCRQRDGSFRPRVIAQPTGAIAYSAAWRDHAGNVQEWLDLWVQDGSSWQLDQDQHVAFITNHLLDRHWERWCQSMAEAHPAKVFQIGLDCHPAPVIWLAANGVSRHDESPWRLCTDDTLLRAHRLAPYVETLHRYLWNGDSQAPRFLALTPNAPEGPSTQPVADEFSGLIPVNPGGSLMALTRSFAIPLPDFVDILSNRANPQDIRDALRNPVSGGNRRLADRASISGKNTGFFFQKNQVAGHLCELLHLKLSVWHGTLVTTATAVRHAGCPFLGLNPDCFGVTLPEPETSLPFLWSHQVSLEAPPQCITAMVGDVGEPCFVPNQDLRQSLYRSPSVLTEVRGLARVRVRRISEPDDHGLVVMDGTLLSEEPLHAGRLDLLEMDWVLPRLGRLRLYGRIEGKAETPGEYRFCTLQTKLQPDVREWLDSGKGGLTSDRVEFHLLPRIGTPCDLYSLGVIGARILFHRPDGTAPVIDDLLSLARAYRQRYSNANWSTGTASLHEFIKTGEAGPIDERLGPQWLLSGGEVSSSEAFREIPPALWWSAVDFLTRMFPGEALDSFCKSNEDFQPRALPETFTAPVAALEALLVRTRELLFGNPSANRELRQIIQQAKAHR
jgi:hypothetical protein